MNKLINISALTLLLFGCAKETSLESQSGEGSVLFECVAEPSIGITTKADDDTQTYYYLVDSLIPTSADFALHITGDYVDYETGEAMTYDKSYESLDSYNDNVPLLGAGDYKAVLSYGDITVESAENACFTGELEFEIVARKYDSAEITATLANSMIRLQTDEWFDKYYSQAEFTITTSALNEFIFSQDAEEEVIIFIAPESTLLLKGSATNAQTGAEVEFPESEIGVSAVRTLNTIVVSADQAGGATLSVRFDQSLTEISFEDIDLNPENNEDVEVEKTETDEDSDDSNTESDNQ